MRSVSKMYRASKMMIAYSFIGTVLITSFQNCGPGFKVDSSYDSASEGAAGLNPGMAPTDPGTQVISQNPVIVNRNYVVSVLNDIFSVNGQVRGDIRPEIDTWIFVQSAQFGGGCDVGTTASAQDCGPVRTRIGFGPNAGQFEGTEVSEDKSTLPISLAASTVRQSLMLKACENISSVNGAMNYLREKLGVAAGTELSDKIMSDMYLLFFRDEPPEAAVLTVIRNLNTDLKNNNENLEDRWRTVFSFICELPGWQSP